MDIKKHIPNTITCCNLLCGSAAVVFATQHQFVYAFFLLIAGAVFDLFDGMSARLLKVSSPLGLQLDSLADDITFGLAPAMMVYCYLQPAMGAWGLPVLVMAAFSALRLAKFNIDDRQRSGFIGLATPANAIFWGSVCCIPELLTATGDPKAAGIILMVACALSCYLLLAEIPFFSFKFHSLAWKANKTAYIFLIAAAIMLLCSMVWAYVLGKPHLVFAGSATSIVWYVALNIILHLSQKKHL
ncbi:MAG TPA: CDP-diacylglycerol--serine O-phosphatidyltransferase [Bacteroidales bacterium]|nr:CDP-diacylglycerol--serine O-phosphatidyltransferase [Bacteroidales bacterium]